MKNFKLFLVALVGIALSSCSMMDKDTNYQISDLQGLWLEDNTQHYVRFTTEKSDEAGYLLGREWDDKDWSDPDMTFEEFLIWNREQLGHPGNGWFKYKLENSTNLTEIILMDNEGAEFDKLYVITKLNDTRLEYYNKKLSSEKFYFSKVVETK